MSNYSKANNGIQINLDTQMIDILAAHFLLHMFYKSSLHSFIKMNLLNLGWTELELIYIAAYFILH